jgi:hypothetical protein
VDTVRKSPCGSCPYLRRVPSGVWAPEEYVKLRQYDGDIVEQVVSGGTRVFHCHTDTAEVCAGWAGHRDPADLLAVRLGIADGRLDPAILDYAPVVPLFGSGAEAADHGLRDVEAPGAEARRAIDKIERRRGMSPDRPT